MNSKITSLYLLSLFICNNACSQSGSWTNYNSTNSGLPINYVRAIVQENDSVYWIGTSAGAARFDGTNWTVFNTSNSGISSNNIRSIVLDGHVKWFGTVGGGIAKYNDTTWTVYTTSNSGISDNQILCLTMDSGGFLWMGSVSGGVSHFDKVNSWVVYNTLNSGLADNNVRAINATDTNDVWFGTINGVSRKNGSTWTTFDTSNSPLTANDIRTIKKDSSGKIWMGMWDTIIYDGGIASFDGTNWAIYDTASAGIVACTDILIDPCNRIWGGLLFLNIFDGTNWIRYDTSNSPLQDYTIQVLLEDCRERVWIGTVTDGIYVFANDCSAPVTCPFTTGINLHPSAENILKVYPNPTTSSSPTIIFYPSMRTTEEIVINDITGKEIGRYALPIRSTEMQITLPEMSKGIYVARMTGDGAGGMAKFVVE